MNDKAKERVNEIAAPVRELLQKLIRKKIKTKEERQDLADFLGIQLSSISNMLYKGQGGLDLWLATLVYCYQINVEQITFFFENYGEITGKVDDLAPEDREWLRIGSLLDPSDKVFASKLVESSIDLHRDIYEKKKKSRSVKK